MGSGERREHSKPEKCFFCGSNNLKRVSENSRSYVCQSCKCIHRIKGVNKGKITDKKYDQVTGNIYEWVVSGSLINACIIDGRKVRPVGFCGYLECNLEICQRLGIVPADGSKCCKKERGLA